MSGRPRAMDKTWDGIPIAREPPYACCVVVWRETAGAREFLLLHRLAPGGADFEGDWAWTPPAGARQPGEPPDTAAARELREETGLHMPLTAVPVPAALADVSHYLAEASPKADVRLDAEHDRFAWLPLAEALSMCLPRRVATGLAFTAERIDRAKGRKDMTR